MEHDAQRFFAQCCEKRLQVYLQPKGLPGSSPQELQSLSRFKILLDQTCLHIAEKRLLQADDFRRFHEDGGQEETNSLCIPSLPLWLHLEAPQLVHGGFAKKN